MTNKEMRKHILAAAKSARQSFKHVAPTGDKIISIDWGVPCVAINGIQANINKPSFF